jgi:alkylation response protein AidB-like acyl-CoA dehydrogenase
MDAELAAGLAGIRDVLRADEARAETERRLPATSVDALRSLDLFALSSPEAVGGWEAPPLLQMEVFEVVARSSAAAGWNLFVGALHTSFPAAFLGDGAVAEIFGSGDDGRRFPVVAGQMQPVGTGRRTEGGIVVSGRYSWGSGISHADYVLGGAMLPEDEQSVPRRFRVFVVPRDRVEVLDNWQVVGVSGSGSYDYAVDEVLVPDGWWFDYPDPIPRRGETRFRAPVQSLIGSAHIGFGLGVGERAFEEMASLAVSKTRTNARGSIAGSEVFQRELGRAYLALASARERGTAVLANLGRLQESGGPEGLPIGEAVVADIRATASWVTEVAVDVANRAMRFSGGTAIRLDSPVQRSIREALVAQAHMYATDANYAVLGKAILDATKPVEPTGSFAAPKPLPPA